MNESPKLEFYFQPFSELIHDKDQPVLFVVFEEQVDLIVGKQFPEVEALRQRLDSVKRKGNETVTIFHLPRGEKLVPAGVIYIEYPWRKKRPSKNWDLGSINFYRKLGERTAFAVGRLREMGFKEATVLLPGRFHPENLKSGTDRERQLEMFVRTMVESIVYANGSLDDFRTDPDPRIAKVNFTYFGQYERTVLHFFNRAIGAGAEMGDALVLVRTLIELPGNKKYPLEFVRKILGTNIGAGKASPCWRSVQQTAFSSNVKAQLIYGAEGMEKKGFGLIAAVGRGSKYEPCLLKLHYKPKKRSKPPKKISLIGKGVTFDSGGVDLKGADSYQNMHYDMAGAATAVGVLKLADDMNLNVEIVALLPIVENTAGSKATRPHDIVRAYDGQTVEIKNTDAEGRLILADALAYSERHVKPDCSVTVATLCDMSEFAPDFLKVVVNDSGLKKRAELAEKRSNEKVLLFPPLEHFNEVDRAFVGSVTDLKNDTGHAYYHSGMIFLGSFLSRDPSPWMFVDVAAVFETDAQESGAGPGFGVRFLWQFVKQFA